MPRRDTLEVWFETNRDAESAAFQWVVDRKAGLHTQSMRGWHDTMRETFKCPAANYTTLRDWYIRNHRQLYDDAMATHSCRGAERSAKVPRVKTETFARSDTDLSALARHEDFIVTSAVNNVPANEGFLAALERWAEERHGKIIVNPVRYKNPQTRREADLNRADQWWDRRLHPYMLQDELRPHPLLSIMTMKAQATTSNPLPARLDGRTKERSAVFGHPQLQMRTVPTPQNRLPKILYSTGAVTDKLYSDTVAGDMAEFHHSLAAVIVEVRGDRFHLREVIWDGSKFIDVDRQFGASAIEHAPRAAGFVMGDLHLYWESEDVLESIFGDGGVFEAINPEKTFLHDLFDATSVNPYEANSLLTRAAFARKGLTNLQRELNYSAEWLNGRLPKGDHKYYVTPSNHNDMLDRWLQKGERGVEAENLRLYHDLCSAMLRYEEKHDKFPPAIELALQEFTHFDRDDVSFLHIDDSVLVRRVECAAHGHLGPNGARGAKGNLSRIGVRGMYAHVHSPCIYQGANFVGYCAGKLGYAKGPSGWLWTQGIVHDNGYRQMIHCLPGSHWRG